MGSYRSFGLFGLILLAFGVIGGIITSSWNSIYVLAHLIGGIAMLGLYVFTHVENLRESVTGRKTQYATNTIVYTMLTLTVIGFVNYLGAQHEWRFDATEAGIFSLADQTETLLDGLDQDIEILAFFRENESAAAQSLLETYAAGSNRLSFRMIDPDKRPELAQQYEVTQYGTLVLASDDDSIRITELSEEALTNAMIRFMSAETKRIYFTTGHGEPDLEARETQDGFGQFKAAIQNEGAEVQPLLLATIPDVPGDADLLIIAGPQRPFLENEIAALQRYLDRGGNTLFLLEPRFNEDLNALLAERGIVVGNDVIVDEQVTLFSGPQVGIEPVVRDYGLHPITEGFDQNTLYRIVRSVRPADELPDGVGVTEIVRTSPASWAETGVDQLFETGEVDRADGDESGPISIAVAATLTGSALNWTAPAIDTAPDVSGASDTEDESESGAADSEDESETGEADDETALATDAVDDTEPDVMPELIATPEPATPSNLEGRVVVVGDAEWVNNSRLTLMFNEDLALNMVGWLTGGDAETIAIRPRARRASRISLTQDEGWAVFYAVVLLLPELVLLAGLAIWWRRRR